MDYQDLDYQDLEKRLEEKRLMLQIKKDFQYNKKRHLELLNLRSRNFSSNQDVFKNKESRSVLSDENFFELLEYSIRMSSHCHWENRFQYFELIEKLIERLVNDPIDSIDSSELTNKYKAIDDASEDLQAQLILLEPNPKSEGFPDLIDELLNFFEFDFRDILDENISENFDLSDPQELLLRNEACNLKYQEILKESIPKIFIEMKDRYS